MDDFDKTGTLTKGEPELTDLKSFGSYSEDELFAIIGSAAKGSEHPLGEAIVKAAEQKAAAFLHVEHFEAISGHGIKAIVQEQRIAIGNIRLMKQVVGEDLTCYQKEMEQLEAIAKTVMLIAIEGKVEGRYGEGGIQASRQILATNGD